LIISLQGYQGMVDGGDHIVPAEWKTVSNIIQRVCFFAYWWICEFWLDNWYYFLSL